MSLISAQKDYEPPNNAGSLVQKLYPSWRLLLHLHITRAQQGQQMWSRCSGDQYVVWAWT